MVKKFGPTIKKLQRAINAKVEDKILINKTQVYHQDTDIVTEIIHIKKVICDSTTKKNKYIELFYSTSDVQIILFLRDYWYELNGWEIPTDNEEWNKVREKFVKDNGNGMVHNR